MADTGDQARLEARFREQVEASIQAKRELLDGLDSCVAVAQLLIATYRNEGQLFLFGNGGSAADAQHIAAEFLGRYYLERPAMAATALTVNTSALTAIGNDYAFENVFARQVEALGRRGDVAIGISTSGNAANVLAGLRAARERGMATVAMTGRGGGQARELVDLWVGVPSDDVPRIQESHIMIGHIWSELVEAELYG
ncbi:MAG TPA: D-sedoheptulose 7-phosphate isomerase [Candidatus Limnocylindrales bacterium]|nr:D-sedoheptulose 7-phosphate isomerase [Candidatus Limnocylindrales bacterium]